MLNGYVSGGAEGVKTTMEDSRPYLPAAGYNWLLPLYDPIVKLLGGEQARKALLEQAALRPGQRALDIGCGTGTLVTLIKRLHPNVEVCGLDPDPKALARARRKAERASVTIRLDPGFADDLPYPDASFDKVFSSFMFHHLQQDEKGKALREVRRVLRPGGSLHLLDFGGQESGAGGFLAHLLHSSHRLRDNSEDRILSLMSRAGFADAKKVSQGSMLFALMRINYYKASVPTPS
jgi:ubiquinone/menaquinone biosynthesis C-methylase UbiE